MLLDGLTFDVRAGEIVAIAGVEGNGQRTLGDILSSLCALEAGRIEVDGREVTPGRAGAMAAAGIAVIPEDRHDSGCVLDFSVAENIFIADPDRVATNGMMKARRCITGVDVDPEVRHPCTASTAPMCRSAAGTSNESCWRASFRTILRVLVEGATARGLDVGAIEYMSAHCALRRTMVWRCC